MGVSKILGSLTVCAALAGVSASAQETTYTLYGTPGMVEMPTARSAPDGEIFATYSHWRLQQKTSLTFQITPRLSGTFRYSGIDERSGPGTDGTFDRSFDLRYRFIDESEFMPAVAVGIQDFMGTGLLSGEYVVATKGITDSIDVSAGLGWGRFGSRNGFTNPFGSLDSSFNTRPALDFGVGGEISGGQFFRGDAALFGGIDYRYSEKLSFQLEYSSDAYAREVANGSFVSKSPINVGMIYRPTSNIALNLAYLQGSEIAGGVTVAVNPARRIAPSGLESGPMPIAPLGGNRAAAASWNAGSSIGSDLISDLGEAGLRLVAYESGGSNLRVQYANNRYRSEAQAMGRAARILTNHLPNSITSITLEPTRNGIPLSSITFDRSDLEAQEIRANGASDLLAASHVGDGSAAADFMTAASDEPKFTWGLIPYLELILFNGNAPVQADFGGELSASYKFHPNLVLNGSIRQSLSGRRVQAARVEPDNGYPNVRTYGHLYGADGGPVLTNLSLTHYGRPGENLYSRASVGYFETMFGGVSGELLWKPVDSRLALGAELNYVGQRDFDMLFGFQDYSVLSGHVSAYYDFENGFHGQVDVGRYLAGDLGATFAVDREFENGWKVGAYFTVTDMPFEAFGEGSFDKGIRVTAPIDFFLGNPTRRSLSSNLNSLSRDGGARLNVDGRLYDFVREGHTAGQMGDTWGRFWR